MVHSSISYFAHVTSEDRTPPVKAPSHNITPPKSRRLGSLGETVFTNKSFRRPSEYLFKVRRFFQPVCHEEAPVKLIACSRWRIAFRLRLVWLPFLGTITSARTLTTLSTRFIWDIPYKERSTSIVGLGERIRTSMRLAALFPKQAINQIEPHLGCMAAGEGIEPTQGVLEAPVLPLY